jgi:hypothetical protein
MKYVFMHVPKCAGTTIHNFLVKGFSPAEICPERFNALHAATSDELDRYKLFSGHMDYASLSRIPGEKFTMTTLREPRSRIISLYKYWRSFDLEFAFRNDLHLPITAKSLPFTEFLRCQKNGVQANIRNSAVRFFLGHCWSDEQGSLVIDDSAALELSVRNLATFDLIGETSDLSPMVSTLSQKLGIDAPEEIPRDNKTQSDLAEEEFQTDEAIDLLNELTVLDRAFYERGLDMIARRSRSPNLLEKLGATMLRSSAGRRFQQKSRPSLRTRADL